MRQLIRPLTALIITALICGTILLIAYRVWPTPYRYDTVKRPYFGGGGGVTHSEEVYRIDRLSGDAVKVVDTNPRRSNP